MVGRAERGRVPIASRPANTRGARSLQVVGRAVLRPGVAGNRDCDWVYVCERIHLMPPSRTMRTTRVLLLVVTAVIAILVALLFPALRSAKDRAKRMTCINSLRQINLGVRMYSDDANDTPPSSGATNTTGLFSGYKELLKSYVGVKGASSSQDRSFACPADKFFPSFAATNAVPPWQWVRESLHDQPFFNYSSYAFNGGDNQTRVSEAGPWTPPGPTGRKLSSIRQPARTVLVMEASALGTDVTANHPVGTPWTS